MWIGIVVLITFSLCTIACLVLSIRGAMLRQWHVAGALLIPAVGIGGTIIMLVGRPLSLELFGDANLEIVPESAQQMVGEELAEFHTGSARFGLTYDEDTQIFSWYDEVYADDGGVSGRNQSAVTWSGGWEVIEDQLCRSIGQNDICFSVYRDGDEYYEVNHRDEIVNRFIAVAMPLKPSGGKPLSNIVSRAVLEGRSYAGELLWHFRNPHFQAEFSNDGMTLTVSRGNDASSMDVEEVGSYSIDDNGKVCIEGVFHIASECLLVHARSGGIDLVRENQKVLVQLNELR